MKTPRPAYPPAGNRREGCECGGGERGGRAERFSTEVDIETALVDRYVQQNNYPERLKLRHMARLWSHRSDITAVKGLALRGTSQKLATTKAANPA